MTCVLAFGKSQLGAFARGHRILQLRGEIDYDLHCLGFWEERYQPLTWHESDRIKYNPVVLQDLRSAIERLAPDCLVASLLGAEHYLHGIINDPRPFDFLLPGHPQHEWSPATELIPYDMIAKRFRGDLDWQFDIVRAARAWCRLPIYHIEAPPPVGNAELIATRVYGHFRKKMQQFGRPTVAFRYKVWWLFWQMVKDICAELGVIPVEGPPVTRDENGFLAEIYFLDGVHASDDYGALIARELAATMGSQGG